MIAGEEAANAEDPRSLFWAYDPAIHTEEDLEQWLQTVAAAEEAALEISLIPHFTLEPDSTPELASRFIELYQQHRDGFDIGSAEFDMGKRTFSRAITPAFWGFSKEDVRGLFSEVTEEEKALIAPEHIHDVLWKKGRYYGTRNGSTIDSLAFDSESYAATYGRLTYVKERTEGRTRAANERENPDFNPNDDKVARSVVHYLDAKRDKMQKVVDNLRLQDESLAKLRQAAQTHNLGHGLMSGEELKDRILLAVNGSFNTILQAMKVQLKWDSETTARIRVAMWQRLFGAPDRVSYWQDMLHLAKVYGMQKVARMQNRIDEVDRYKKRDQETKLAS